MAQDISPMLAHSAEPSEARFSVRALLIVMSVMALVAAVLGPIVRGLEGQAQSRVLVFWAAWLCAAILGIAYKARRRIHAERLAGRTLLALPMFDERVPSATSSRRHINVFLALLIWIFFFLMVTIQAIQPPAPRQPLELLISFGVIGFASIWWAGRAVAIVWWRNSIRFCEHGVLWDQQVVLWDHLVESKQSPSNVTVLELQGIDQHNMDVLWKLRVPADDWDAVNELIDSKATSRPSLPSEPSVLELGRIPISRAVRSRHFSKYLLRIPCGIAIFVATVYLFQRGVTGVAEFDQSIPVGAFLGIFTEVWRWRASGKQAGAPLVRLVGRQSWYAPLPSVALAIGLCWVGYHFGWRYEWIAYGGGIGFGWVVVAALHDMGARQLDLRENGVVLVGGWYGQWPNVRLLKWNRETNGRLVIASGWKRIISVVPPEQREAVQTVLQQKLPTYTVANGAVERIIAAT